MAENEKLTQAQQVNALATRMGQECKVLHGETAANAASINTINGTLATHGSDISALQTTVGEHTTSISGLQTTVGEHGTAITSLQTTVGQHADKLTALESNIGSVINDSLVSLTTTYSSTKIDSQITAAKQAVKDDLLGGAGEAYNTLQELAALIQENQSAIEALENIAAGHVRFDQAQTITEEQKTQARANIGAAAGSALEALTTRVGAVETKAADNEAHIGTLASLTTDAKADLVAAINEVDANANAAKTQADKGVADAAAAMEALNAFKAEVGATDTDFVAAFEAALAA